MIWKGPGLRGVQKTDIRYDFEEGESTCANYEKIKAECLANRVLQTILGECRVGRPPSHVTRCEFP